MTPTDASQPIFSKMKFLLVCALVVVAVASVDCAHRNMDCGVLCTRILSPVCAVDLKNIIGGLVTFRSQCEMKLYNCEHDAFMIELYKGICKHEDLSPFLDYDE